jgi:hypothetical protein
MTPVETALREAVKELISLRDDQYDCCTNQQGEYTCPEDKAEIDRLDAIIDRCREALGDNPEATA